MKNKMLPAILASIVGVGGVAQGEISISWTTPNGMVPNASVTGGTVDEGIGILDPSINPLGQVYAQLIFSTDNVADRASVGAGLTGDDTLLANAIVGRTGEAGNDIDDGGTAGTFYGSFLAGAPTVLEPFNPGFIFARVFETVQGNVGPGTWYYDGPVVAAVDVGRLDPPQLYGANADGLPGGFGDELNLQVIPEPGTFGLLALGMLSLAFRRRSKLVA